MYNYPGFEQERVLYYVWFDLFSLIVSIGLKMHHLTKNFLEIKALSVSPNILEQIRSELSQKVQNDFLILTLKHK